MAVDRELHQVRPRDLEDVGEEDADEPEVKAPQVGTEIRENRPELMHGELVLCRRSVVATEGVTAPADQGATTSTSYPISWFSCLRVRRTGAAS